MWAEANSKCRRGVTTSISQLLELRGATWGSIYRLWVLTPFIHTWCRLPAGSQTLENHVLSSVHTVRKKYFVREDLAITILLHLFSMSPEKLSRENVDQSPVTSRISSRSSSK